MKKNMRFKSLITTLLMFVFLTFSMAALADPPDPCTDPEVPCPVDGGLSLLIAAGVGLGARKAYQAKKKQAL